MSACGWAGGRAGGREGYEICTPRLAKLCACYEICTSRERSDPLHLPRIADFGQPKQEVSFAPATKSDHHVRKCTRRHNESAVARSARSGPPDFASLLSRSALFRQASVRNTSIRHRCLTTTVTTPSVTTLLEKSHLQPQFQLSPFACSSALHWHFN